MPRFEHALPSATLSLVLRAMSSCFSCQFCAATWSPMQRAACPNPAYARASIVWSFEQTHKWNFSNFKFYGMKSSSKSKVKRCIRIKLNKINPQPRVINYTEYFSSFLWPLLLNDILFKKSYLKIFFNGLLKTTLCVPWARWRVWARGCGRWWPGRSFACSGGWNPGSNTRGLPQP